MVALGNPAQALDRRSRAGARAPRRRGGAVAYVFLIPWLIGVIGITLGPMLASLYLSFTDYRLGSTPSWVGAANYVRLFTQDDRFIASAGVTARYVLVSVPLQLVFALAIAVLLDRGVRGLAIYRSIYYLPSLLGSSVAVAVLWRQIFSSQGLVVQVADWFGITMGGWIADPAHALDTLIVLNVWTFGSPMVIFLAGLRQIPNDLVEAARVDGAGALRRFWSVILPLLSPVVFFNLVLQLIGAFQAFTPAYIISSGTGGPADSTLFYSLYLFQSGFQAFNMGYASAMAWILFIVIGAFTAVNFIASKYWVHYET
ncbi:binding-protein-dependent transport systems inner membrane component [Beutenbergia cavernae DSM 12333]|uniref:Binding-protein-dependent transport systems inner membrane component n=1 Tax=Beutenbergia cavernae (strain ATCC BAA-8 / DSM 12333 / CCUG 43141 / JCM 11478 / NBRC 16432 / NCIMB 13614 / HKI 0122) TaxID=471853 RepID=C5C2V3_BEUC1|nr:binding-protein-dependent transport systems inner membrane component [Beutenbergia cavernae DSM 12333]